MSNLNVKEWFPTLISHETLENTEILNDHLKQKAYRLQDVQKNVKNTDWKCDTFSTMNVYDPFKDSDDKILNFIDHVKQKVKTFGENFGVLHFDYDCVDFWFNISSPGSYQEYHQHPACHFSAVYYVDVPQNSGSISFKSIQSVADMFPLPIVEGELTESSFQTCTYNVKTSSLVLFRSNLPHMVTKNESKNDRISIAMNFNTKRKPNV